MKTQKALKPRQRRRLRIIFITLGTMLLMAATIILFLPSGIEWGTEERLLRAYFDDVEIEDVNFNPFTGKLVLKDTRCKTKDEEVLYVRRLVLGMDWWPLWKGRIRMQVLSLQGVSLQVTQHSDGSWFVAGIPFPPKGDTELLKAEKAWQWGLMALDLRDIRITYRGPGFERQITVVQAHLDPIRTWIPNESSHFNVSVRADKGLVEISGEGNPFGPKTSLSTDAQVENIDLAWIAPFLGHKGIRAVSGVLSGKAKITTPLWKMTTGELKIRGSLSLKKLETLMDRGAVSLNVKQDGLSAVGSFTYDRGGRMAIKMDISGKGLRADNPKTGHHGLALDKMDLKDLRLDGLNLIQANEMQFAGTKLLGRNIVGKEVAEQPTHALTLKSLILREVRLSDLNRLEINQATIGGLLGWLDRDNRDQKDMMRRFTERVISRGGKPEQEQKLGLSFRIGRLDITDKSRVVVQDASVDPASTLTFSPEAHVKIEADFLKNMAMRDLKVDGALSLNELETRLGGAKAPLHVKQEGLSLSGSFRYERGADLAGSMDLNGKELRVDNLKTGLQILSLKNLDLKGGRLVGINRIEVREMELGGAKALGQTSEGKAVAGDPTHALTLKSLLLREVRLSDLKRLEISQATIGGMLGWLERDSQGQMEVMKWFPVKAASEEEKSKQVQKRPWSVGIEKLSITQESRIVFRDTSVTPPFALTFFPFETQIGLLDTRSPEHKTPVELRAKIGKYWGVEAVGTIQPFSEKPAMDLSGKFESIDLRELAAYTVQRLGYRAKSGQLDADIKWRVQQGLVDAEANLVIDKLRVERVIEGKEEAFNQVFGVPLKTALSMLRDRNDRVVLRVPIQGDLRDPKFRLHQVVAKAVGNAVTQGALSYFAPLGVTLLTGVVLPPGTVFVAKQLFDLATTLRFKPVVFAPSSYALSPENKTYLEQMAARLKDRPRVKIVLCGIGTVTDLKERQGITLSRPDAGKEKRTGSDLPEESSPDANQITLTNEERDRLLVLAEHRSQAVKEALVKEGGIDARRLIICSPEVENRERATPRVEMGM